MATSSDNSFSNTLLSITTAKLEQLAKKQKTFESHHENIRTRIAEESKDLEKVRILSEGLKLSFAIPLSDGAVVRGTTKNPRMEIDLKNFDRFLAQARYDPSISETAIKRWQGALRRHLEVQSLKYLYADLYGRLTTEWLSSKQRVDSIDSKEDADIDVSYEHVSSSKRVSGRLQWESSVFDPAKVTSESVLSMLQGMFEPPEQRSKQLAQALTALRKRITTFESSLAKITNFTEETLKWTISGLITSDLLTEEKRVVLKGFLENSVVLGEIADVLNMVGVTGPLSMLGMLTLYTADSCSRRVVVGRYCSARGTPTT